MLKMAQREEEITSLCRWFDDEERKKFEGKRQRNRQTERQRETDRETDRVVFMVCVRIYGGSLGVGVLEKDKEDETAIIEKEREKDCRLQMWQRKKKGKKRKKEDPWQTEEMKWDDTYLRLLEWVCVKKSRACVFFWRACACVCVW